MSDIICVTNRKLCEGNFLSRIDEICRYSPKAVILREKDLDEPDYLSLAFDVEKICEARGVLFVAHSFPSAAKRALHMPLPFFSKRDLEYLGTSVHSVEDAVKAEKKGATYVIAGHIFETDCKKGLEGRGLGFVKEISENISIPVYAIGGIGPQNYKSVIEAGAKGVAIMSGLMTCKDVGEYFSAF